MEIENLTASYKLKSIFNIYFIRTCWLKSFHINKREWHTPQKYKKTIEKKNKNSHKNNHAYDYHTCKAWCSGS